MVEAMDTDTAMDNASSDSSAPLTLASLPVEILTDILSNIFVTENDLKDLYNAVRSCKQLYNVLWANRFFLLARPGIATVQHFDLALASVRATNLVSKALSTDHVLAPRDILQQIFPVDCNPTLAEFHAVMDLARFADSALYLIMDLPMPAPKTMGLLPLQETAWYSRFRRTVYRLTICAAALSGAYLEPFLQKQVPQPDGFLDRILYSSLMFVGGDPDDDSGPYQPTHQDLQYFHQFPLFRPPAAGISSNTQLFGETEFIFQPVADWLLADMTAAEKESESSSPHHEPELLKNPLAPARLVTIPTLAAGDDGNALLDEEYTSKLAAVDHVPKWSIYRQVQQAVRLAQELTSMVEGDRWGRGLFVPPYLAEPISVRRRRQLAHRSEIANLEANDKELDPASVRKAKMVRYGVFRPEEVLSHTCMYVHPNSLTMSRMSCWAEQKKQATQRGGYQWESNMTVAHRLFGGIPGRVLRIERLLFAVAARRGTNHSGNLPSGGIHPGLLSYVEALPWAEVPRTEKEDDRITPPSAAWDVFYGDVINTYYQFSRWNGFGWGFDRHVRREPFRLEPSAYMIL